MTNKKKNLKVFISAVFLAVPILSSFISTAHLISFFSLGNYIWMAVTLAIVYEIGSITSFVTPFILTKLNKNLMWSIFIILVLLQILGNVYFSFSFINQQLVKDSGWLASFQELVGYFAGSDTSLIKIIISCLIGVPIPIISLFFLKSLLEYANPKEVEEITNDIVEVIEEKKENVEQSEESEDVISEEFEIIPTPIPTPIPISVEEIVNPQTETKQDNISSNKISSVVGNQEFRK